MPNLGLDDGLYFIRRPAHGKPGMHHFGILDIGNRIQYPGVDPFTPVIIEMTPPCLAIRYFTGHDFWINLGHIPDETEAIQRMRLAARQPQYDLLQNNCEHFAKMVALGSRESSQVWEGVAKVGLTALFIAAIWPTDD